MIKRRDLLLGAGTLLATGCSMGSPALVVRQAFPNPFRGVSRFGVAPLDFEALIVDDKTEIEWLRDKSPDTRESWAADKLAMNEPFTVELLNRALAAGIGISLSDDPATGLVVVRGHILSINPGYFAGFLAQPSKTRMELELTAPGGRSLDVVALQASTPSTFASAASGTRLRRDASELGRMAADYLAERVQQA